jgi:hypothetical protein
MTVINYGAQQALAEKIRSSGRLRAGATRDVSTVDSRPSRRHDTSCNMTAKRPENIFQFRVSLDHLEPRIWRRIQVPDSFTLKQLHRVIQLVMGWQDSHLHEFSLSGKRCGEPNSEDEENVIDERTVRLRNLALSNCDGIGYVYDLGDDW